MTSWLTYIPVVILVVYHIVLLLTGEIKKYWWAALIGLLSAAALWWILKRFFAIVEVNLMMTAVIVIVSFELLQVRNHKMSILFHLLFLIIVTVISALPFLYGVASAVSAHPFLYGGERAVSTLPFLYEVERAVNGFILLLVYFLAKSNQSYMKQTYEESAARYQNMVLTRQVNEVQNIYMTMRGWRHDYHNHLQTLKAHLKLKQLEEARVYLDHLETDLDNINNMIESGNVNLDAILNSKLSLAQKQDIEINYKAEVPSALSVSDIDLCVLIGNLIDNAVEACEKITETDNRRFIRLYIGVLKQQLYISVTNTTNEAIRKLDEEYITTKRGNHGHGLKRINKIVEKYEGYINRKNEPGVFVTEIMLPL